MSSSTKSSPTVVSARMSSATGGLGSMTPASRAAVSSRTGGSGSRTWEIGRFSESRGIAASSPTPGRPVVSMSGGFGDLGRSTVAGPDDCVNEMPEVAV